MIWLINTFKIPSPYYSIEVRIYYERTNYESDDRFALRIFVTLFVLR